MTITIIKKLKEKCNHLWDQIAAGSFDKKENYFITGSTGNDAWKRRKCNYSLLFIFHTTSITIQGCRAYQNMNAALIWNT